jgi:hypothetical protein
MTPEERRERQAARARYAENRDEYISQHRAWRAANLKKAQEYQREWRRARRAANPEKYRAQERARHPEKEKGKNMKRHGRRANLQASLAVINLPTIAEKGNEP